MAWDESKFKKPSATELKSKLTPLQYKVTQDDGTEPPFENEYWDNKKDGIYVDRVSGEPLFSSKEKYDSGTGWPSFSKPLVEKNIVTKKDRKLFVTRTEVRSRVGDSHLGHVFDDGPKPTSLRYCMNSASLRFVAAEDLEKEGYDEFKNLFFADSSPRPANSREPQSQKTTSQLERATLAGGCFWGVQHILDRVPGVKNTRVGYIGGTLESPTYRDITTGQTGHAEAVEVEFDPNIISYEKILSYFWRLHDPTQLNRQGVDIGTQYRSAIFYHSEAQRIAAEKSKAEFDKSGVFKTKAVTQITAAGTFYTGEDYHQKYFDNNPGRVCHTLRDR